MAAAPVAAREENPGHQPPFGSEPLAPLDRVRDLETVPPGFELSAAEAIEIADGAPEVADERAESPAMEPQASTRGSDRWQIDYFQDGTDVAQAVIDDASGEVIEAWRNQQVEVKLARGYEDAVAGNVNEAWIWIPLCVLFLLPFVDRRRPFRLLHLDLLVLLSFSVSQFFFNKGEIVWSVPLVYPVLAYLFVRMAFAGFRPQQRQGALVPHLPIRWLAIAAVALGIFRIGLNVVDSQVIDIGFANVVGADRIASGEGVYDGQFTPLIDRGDSYGPVSYLSYVPFEQVLPWDGGLESLPAAHAAAILFDLVVVGLLLVIGRRLREGARGQRSRDRARLRLARLSVHALCAQRQRRQRRPARGAADRGADRLRLAAQARARDRGGGGDQVRADRPRAAVRRRTGRAPPPLERASSRAAFLAVWAVVLLPLLPEGGLREFYDRTFGYQASRGSPFSVWGLEPSLDNVQKLARVFPVLIGAALFFVPKRRTNLQVAALGAAVLIATQVGSTHWFYFFILWWTPYVLINLFATQERISGVREPRPEPPRQDVLSAAAHSS